MKLERQINAAHPVPQDLSKLCPSIKDQLIAYMSSEDGANKKGCWVDITAVQYDNINRDVMSLFSMVPSIENLMGVMLLIYCIFLTHDEAKALLAKDGKPFGDKGMFMVDSMKVIGRDGIDGLKKGSTESNLEKDAEPIITAYNLQVMIDHMKGRQTIGPDGKRKDVKYTSGRSISNVPSYPNFLFYLFSSCLNKS